MATLERAPSAYTLPTTPSFSLAAIASPLHMPQSHMHAACGVRRLLTLSLLLHALAPAAPAFAGYRPTTPSARSRFALMHPGRQRLNAPTTTGARFFHVGAIPNPLHAPPTYALFPALCRALWAVASALIEVRVRVSAERCRWRAAERRHRTGRERMSSPTLDTLQDPILLTPWLCFRGGGFPNPLGGLNSLHTHVLTVSRFRPGRSDADSTREYTGAPAACDARDEAGRRRPAASRAQRRDKTQRLGVAAVAPRIRQVPGVVVR